MISNPPRWPNGARCAVAITFDVDSEACLHGWKPEIAHRRVSTLSWLGYDQVAVPRILGAYRHLGIKQTFFVPAWCMEHRPRLVESMLDDGHEVALHGYIHELTHEHPTRAAEEYWLGKSLDTMERITGRRAAGWRGPLYGFTEHTADLLIEAGFEYDSTLMGDDVPYFLHGAKGDLVEIPIDTAYDDWAQYVENFDFEFFTTIQSPDRAMEVIRAEYEAAHKYGGLFVPVWHPWVSGRPARFERITRLIEDILEAGDVWVTTVEDISRYIRALTDAGEYQPRVDHVPYLTTPVAEGLAAVRGQTDGSEGS